MKKRILILSGLCLLVVLFIWAFSNGWLSGKKPELRDFAVKDTGSITKIFMADRNGKTITLDRKDNKWIVNGKFEADDSWLKQLLECIARVDVKSPVPKSAFDDVVKSLATTHTKVEIYQGEDLVKTYFVGGPTLDHTGTYMLIEGSSVPFITEIKGFNGYLTPQYNLNENSWHSKKIFTAPNSTIKTISVEYPFNPTESFTINYEGNSATISSPSKKNSDELDQQQAKFYKALTDKASFLGLYQGLDVHLADSLRKSQPMLRMRLTQADGAFQELTMYYKEVDERTKQKYDLQGQNLKYDPELYYAFVTGRDDLMMAQDYTMSSLLLRYADFKKK